MSALSDTREALREALEGVLVGREVQPYAPGPTKYPLPAVWIGDHRGSINGPQVTATFPVWIVVNGADRAQAGLLDDLISAVVWSGESNRPFRVEGWQSAFPPWDITVQPPPNYRAATVDVVVPVLTRTFCPPTPIGATVPPVLLEA